MSTSAIDDLLTFFGDTPEHAYQTVRERLVLDLLRRHEISSGRAAELLGIDRLTMMRLQSADGIPVFDLDAEEFAEEFRLRSPR
ncbi:MAG: UPF0175 family protein [Chloroflexia bacterium]|nr:UPF0175 family protein [Chloroflexia bacterium]